MFNLFIYLSRCGFSKFEVVVDAELPVEDPGEQLADPESFLTATQPVATDP